VNAQLQRVAVAALILIALLMVNVNYLQAGQAESLREHPKNGRQFNKQFDIDRGPIVIGGQNVVESKPTGKQLKFQRVYNNGALYAPVTGFMTAYRKTGVELSEDGLLNGTDSRLAVRRLFDILTGKPAKGAHIELTINPDAQKVAYNQLRSRSSTGRAAAVAIEPSTGRILAMASVPSYDPNEIATNDFKKADQAAKRLAQAEGNPLLNKAVEDRFPPGSSFKAVVAAAALESGKFTKDTSVPAPSSYTAPGAGRSLPNSHEGGACGGLGQAPLIAAFAESCNTTFAILANQDVGADRVAEQARKFGFGRKIEVGQRNLSAVSTFPGKVDPALVALAAIGQGDTSATPLQMAMVAAGVANEGKVMKPYVVDRVKTSTLRDLGETEPEVMSEAMSEDNAGQLKEMMRAVVTTGTAQGVITVPGGGGGKTGTAETGRGYNERWFIGFAPYDEPKVAVAVFTEGPGSGGEFSAPIANQIMQAVVNK
jgi:peptidoglycan glycosyltransferase